ncbi:hypothetical protein Pcinc_024187 [Petrolisthes cinctipes]|uniref:Uncharacterized protein n=1 Tax=Petrolisthes cinctipes TaxID=88211 RepID=A0AAE1FBX2_PETCI|nr:hypothetical protein Pcinc_024187 [Petrolisthes cinctipes]
MKERAREGERRKSKRKEEGKGREWNEWRRGLTVKEQTKNGKRSGMKKKRGEIGQARKGDVEGMYVELKKARPEMYPTTLRRLSQPSPPLLPRALILYPLTECSSFS